MASEAISFFDALNEEVPNGQKGLVPYIQALQRWRQWRDNVPLFYTTCVQGNLEMPSLTVQLYPYLWRDPLAPGLLQHAVLYGTTADDSGGSVVLSSFAVDNPANRLELSRGSLQDTEAAYEEFRFPHPAGDVDRLRYCPARPTLVAAKCSGVGISLYDLSRALELVEQRRRELKRRADEAEGSDAAMAERDEREDQEVGERAGEDATASEEQRQQRRGQAGCEVEVEDEEAPGPSSVLESSRQDGVALVWGRSGGGGGDESSSLRLFSGLLSGAVGEYALREDGSLAEVTVRRSGHDGDADVTDLAWSECPAAASGADVAGSSAASSAAPAAPSGLLASAATDGRTLLWDPRQRLPSLRVPRCRQDVNSVAFAPVGGGAGGAASLLATAGDDGIVRVYDIRRLSNSDGGDAAGSSKGAAAAAAATTATATGGGSSGGGASVPPPLHRLKAHRCSVRQLAFSPHSPSLLASADEQGRVMLWDLSRTTPLREGLATRPELVFVHAGHVLPVDDAGWSTELYGTLASVSGFLDPAVVEEVRAHPTGGAALVGQPPAVQVWRPAPGLIPAAGEAGGISRLQD